MKKIALIILILMAAFQAKAQVNMIVPPPGANFRFDDLWNISVMVNAKTGYKNCSFTLELNEQHKGKILTAKSRIFTLGIGSNNYNPGNLGVLKPFQIKYFSEGLYRNLVESSQLFPAGNYFITIRLIGTVDNASLVYKPEELSSVTFTQTTEILFPPQLIYVYDNDTIETNINYTFMWTPPFPILSQSPVKYDVRFCEIIGKQTPYAAFSQNPSFYEAKGLDATILNFPIEAKPFEKDKRYVWQVKANVNGMGAVSEMWSFVVSEKGKPGTTLPKFCPPLADFDAGYYSIYNLTFNLMFNEKYGESVVHYKVLNDHGQLVIAGEVFNGQSGGNLFNYGDNRYVLFIPGLDVGIYTVYVWGVNKGVAKYRFQKEMINN